MPSETPARSARMLTLEIIPVLNKSIPLPSSAVIPSAAAAGIPKASRYHSPAIPAPSLPIQPS